MNLATPSKPAGCVVILERGLGRVLAHTPGNRGFLDDAAVGRRWITLVRSVGWSPRVKVYHAKRGTHPPPAYRMAANLLAWGALSR